MSKPKVFISYSHLDEPWKERLVKHLGVAEKQGLLQTWDDRKLLGGDDWFAEIAKAIEEGSVAVLLVSHNSLTSDFILNEEVPRMLAQRKVQAARFYPIVVEYCDWEAVEWLKQFNLRPRDGRPVGINKDGVFTEQQTNRDLKEIAKEIRLLPPPEPTVSRAPEPLTDECPYLGLEAFTEDKEHLFFGRADFADALFDKVKRHNFVALIGPSGSGKSSVVQAGLFPRLRRDTTIGWQTLLFQPGEDPFFNLAAEFIEFRQPRIKPETARQKAIKELAEQLKDASAVASIIKQSFAARQLDPQRSRLLLVVDQFEELFTLCTEDDRQALLDMLLAAKKTARVKIMLTLRADFMGQAQSLSSLISQLLDKGIVSHRPLSRADLEAVITGPAQHAGLEFEAGLVNLILQEVAAQPDSLPLLEYALKEMWRKRQSRKIGLALYEAVGKVEGAISQHADAVLQELPEAEQALTLRALVRLVRVASEENEADTRLRLPLCELPEAERAVLQTFVNARLLVTKGEKGAGTIEVAHEALIRRWEKLRGALDRDREFLTWRRRLNSRRKAWEQKSCDNKWILYGGERDEAQRWWNGRGAELTVAEIEFITWDDRPDFQIERILSEGSSLVLFSYGEILKSWFATLVFCGEKEKALSIVRKIEYVSSCAEALKWIAEALVKAGMMSEACEAAREALAAAREIRDASYQAKALNSIVETLMKAGMRTEAREVAKEALTAAREIEEDAYSYTRALSSTVKTLVKVGMMAEARDTAREALAAAPNIKQANRAAALSWIAEALIKAGMMTEALATVREIQHASSRTQALNSIIKALVKVGMVTEALATFREIEHSYYRATALSSIAGVLIKAGMVTETLAAARKIEDAYSRTRALNSIVEAMVKAGMTTEVREAATEALATARKIKDAYSRTRALNSIVEAMVKAGMTTEAREAAMEARAAFRKIKKTYYSTQILPSIAKTLMKAGMVTEALAAAHEIIDVSSCAQALMAVADFWLEHGQAEEAGNLLDEVRGTISRVFYDDGRSKALRHLAVILARLHSYRAARETAAQCSSSGDRLTAYTAILREYHIERDPSLAQLFAEEAEEED